MNFVILLKTLVNVLASAIVKHRLMARTIENSQVLETKFFENTWFFERVWESFFGRIPYRA
jgi:hypothetical protein